MKVYKVKLHVVCFLIFCWMFSSDLLGQVDLTKTIFFAGFENNSTKSDQQLATLDLEDGKIYATENPEKDDINSSDYVLCVSTTPSVSPNHTRAEYITGVRNPTEGNVHIFQWMVYFPDDYLDNVVVRNGWNYITQFYSEPCSKYSLGGSNYSFFNDSICYSGGIFNDIMITKDNNNQYEFLFRAYPDCNRVYFDISNLKGKWTKITLEIYWTQNSDGYYNIYIDNELLSAEQNVRTLPGGWVDGTCDLRWKVGLYDAWSSTSVDSVYYYIDNMQWYINQDISVACPECVGAVDCSDFTVEGEVTDSDYGDTNGSISISVTGGTEPYEYYWDDGATNSDRTNLASGDYTVTIIDANSCEITTSFTIEELEDQSSEIVTANTIFSAGFEGNTTQSDQQFATLDLDEGKIFVTNNPEKDNTNSSEYVLCVTTPPSVSPGHTRAEYITGVRNPTEGTTHIFQWMVYFPDDYLDDVDVRNGWNYITQFYSEPCSKYSLGGSSYSFFNDSICYSGGIFNDIMITKDNNNQYEFLFRAYPDCNRVFFDISNHKGKWTKITLEIYWTQNSDGYYNIYIDNDLLEGEKNVRTLPGGWVDGTCDLRWKVGLYDAWSSTSVDSVYYYIDNMQWYIDEDISAVCLPCVSDCSSLNVSGVVTDSDFGEDNGSIDITAIGGSESYSYSWSDGSTLEDRSGLSAGEYVLIVTDDNDCSVVDTFFVSEASDPCIGFDVSGVVSNTDYRESNGTITITVVGGTAPYVYLWSDDSTAEDRSELSAGIYSLTITDANDCTNEVSFEVLENDDPCTDFYVSGTVGDSDYGESNGTITITVAGGTAPYSYLWNDGWTIQDRTDLSTGFYTLTTTDANECTDEVSFEILENVDPCSGFDVSGVVENTDSDVSEGTITISVTGGTSPYSYLWSDGATSQNRTALSAGVYTLTTTDANDCADELELEVYENEDPCIDFYVSALVENCDYGETNGSIDISVNGGTSPYSYLWSDGATSQDRSGLSSGVYTLTTSDANDCIDEQSLEVLENEDPCEGFEVSGVTGDSNYGESTGTITITVVGGTAPYSYLWSDGSTQKDRSELSAGIYILTITDVNDCNLETTFSVGESEDPCVDFEVDERIISCDYDEDNGSITLSVTGGEAPYEYLWSDGETKKNRSHLSSGTYTVTITDNNNCLLTETYIVEEEMLLFGLIRFYPNPTTGLLAVEFMNSSVEDVSVTVRNESNIVVIQQEVNSKSGKNKISLSLAVDEDGNKLESGIYEVELNNGESSFKFEVVKREK